MQPSLYIFIFLHQTTTHERVSKFFGWLYIFIFLHQTTTMIDSSSFKQRCISLYSYIKPQLCWCACLARCVVYLYIPTSNHNSVGAPAWHAALYIFIFLHQTTTPYSSAYSSPLLYIFIFLHQTTTVHLSA